VTTGYAVVFRMSALLWNRSCLLFVRAFVGPVLFPGMYGLLFFQARPLFFRGLLYYGIGHVYFSAGRSEVWCIPGQVCSAFIQAPPLFFQGQLYFGRGLVYFSTGRS